MIFQTFSLTLGDKRCFFFMLAKALQYSCQTFVTAMHIQSQCFKIYSHFVCTVICLMHLCRTPDINCQCCVLASEHHGLGMPWPTIYSKTMKWHSKFWMSSGKLKRYVVSHLFSIKNRQSSTAKKNKILCLWQYG